MMEGMNMAEMDSAARRKAKRQKELQKRKRRKKIFRIFLILLAAFVIFEIFSSHIYKNEKAFREFSKIQFEEEMTLVPEAGKTATEYKYDEQENGFSTAVRFQKKADDYVKEFAASEVNALQKKIREKDDDAVESALLTRWNSYDHPSGVKSLVIHSVLYESKEGEMVPKKDSVSTYLFNAGNTLLIKDAQIMNDSYKEAASKPARKSVKKSYDKKELQKDWDAYFEPTEKRLNNFILTAESIIFYEKAGADGFHVKAEVPLAKLEGAVKDQVVVRLVEPGDKMVAITYDDGPGGKAETEILNTLEKYDSTATFFYLGSRIKEGKENLKKAAEIGCEIGNHSWDHPDLKTLKSKEIKEQLKKTDAAIEKVTGEKPTIFRPPYGSYSQKVLKAAGQPMVLWSVDSKDWESKDAEKVLAVIEGAENLDGSVILMHSIYDSTAEATEKLIPWLNRHGYQTVTVTELVKYQTGEAPKPHEAVTCK